MSIDEQHVALPKLYGAPAYARPTAVVDVTPRPFDPDDLPIEAAMTEEDRALAAELPARTWSSSGVTGMDGHSGSSNGHNGTGTGLRPKSFSLKGIADKFLGSGSGSGS